MLSLATVALFFQAPPNTDKTITYATGTLVIVGGVLLLLGFLFYLMLRYSNRLAQTGPMGDQVRAALLSARQQQIGKTVAERWEQGVYHRETVTDKNWLEKNPLNEIPAGVQEKDGLRGMRNILLDNGRFGTLRPGTAPTSAEAQTYLKQLREWEETVQREARRRQNNEYGEELSKANQNLTGSKAFDSFDFGSLWGQGSEFVLQFTAVVTIIFAVIALGMLRQITPDQAGTILAAIAGYVLGHATARGSRADTVRTTQSPAVAAQLDKPIDADGQQGQLAIQARIGKAA